jgi:chemotaxis protein MotA
MDPMSLLDAPSAAIVVGGTLIATWLRSGQADCRQTLRAIANLGTAPFDADGARAELAVQIREIRQDGLLRATPHHFGDREFDDVTDTLIAQRSIPALLAAHEAHKGRRVEANNRAVRTLAQAAELAPVFGLAGTLVSLSQLPAAGISRGAFTGAIGMAVLTTLYGLLLANLLLAPLSRKVERAAAEEEAERQKLVDWLAGQVSGEIPHTGRPHARPQTQNAAA